MRSNNEGKNVTYGNLYDPEMKFEKGDMFKSADNAENLFTHTHPYLVSRL